MNSIKPRIIKGDDFIDERGKIQFINNFDLSPIKRIYFTSHYNIDTIRAWQGHKVESCWFYCVKGGFKIKLIRIDDWDNPSNECNVFEYELSEEKPQVLVMPNGYVNGFKATKEDSKLMLMSNYGLNEIEDDSIRFDTNTWVNKIKW